MMYTVQEIILQKKESEPTGSDFSLLWPGHSTIKHFPIGNGFRRLTGLLTERRNSLASDMTLRCRECGRDFLFTEGEQQFYTSKGLSNTPSRCPDCRAARKNQGGGHQRGGQRQYYTAICTKCGQEARVPFQPRGDREVYCSDCFQQIHSGNRN